MLAKESTQGKVIRFKNEMNHIVIEAVVKCIEDKIIGQNQAISTSVLHDL